MYIKVQKIFAQEKISVKSYYKCQHIMPRNILANVMVSIKRKLKDIYMEVKRLYVNFDNFEFETLQMEFVKAFI